MPHYDMADDSPALGRARQQLGATSTSTAATRTRPPTQPAHPIRTREQRGVLTVFERKLRAARQVREQRERVRKRLRPSPR